MVVGYGLEPLVGCVFTLRRYGQVCEPMVARGTMPMFYVGGDIDHIAREEFACGFAPFLIPTFAGHAYQKLSASGSGVVNVPVVAA